MSYRNPMHGLNSDGEPDLSVPGVTLPAVTADATPSTPEPSEPAEPETSTVTVDMWEINQRAMERAVSMGQPLPLDGEGNKITPEQVVAWRVERGHGPIFTGDADEISAEDLERILKGLQS